MNAVAKLLAMDMETMETMVMVTSMDTEIMDSQILMDIITIWISYYLYYSYYRK